MASSLSAAAAPLRCLAGPGDSCWNTNDRQTDSFSPTHRTARACVRVCVTGKRHVCVCVCVVRGQTRRLRVNCACGCVVTPQDPVISSLRWWVSSASCFAYRGGGEGGQWRNQGPQDVSREEEIQQINRRK